MNKPPIDQASRRGFLGGASTLLLSACGGGDTAADGETGEIALEFPSWQANEPGLGDVWRELITEFERRHENVTIDFYHVANDEYQDRLVTRLSANDPPDILASGGHYLPIVATGQLDSLNDRLETDGVLDEWQDFQQAGVVDGEHYGLVTHGLTRHLHVNRAYLSEVSIDEPPATPEKLRAAARALADSNLEDVAPWGATTTSHPNVYSEATTFVIGHGGHWARGGEWTVTSPETVAGLELYRELAQLAPPGQDGSGVRQLLADGRIAMIHDGNWVLALLDDLSPDEIRDDIVAAVSPFEHKVTTMGATLSIPSAIDEERKDLVWEFIKLSAEPEFSVLWAEHSDAVPGHVDAVTDELIEQRPELEAVLGNMDGAVDEIPDSDNIRANMGEVQRYIIDALMRLQTTDDDLMEVLTDLEEQLANVTEP